MNIIKCKTKQEIAEICGKKINDLVKNKPNCILGLATGSSPVETYKEAIHLAKEDHVSYAQVKSFNLDEYVAYKDEKDSYKYFMFDNFFKYIDIDLDNTNFPSVNNLNVYDDMIKDAGGIDLQVLGIGANGHIAFNEPNTSFDSTTHIVNLTKKTIEDNARFFASIDDVPTQAMTMGLKTIMQAKEIILIATGENKASAIKNLVDEKKSESCPASVLKDHPNVTIYIDEEAGSLLK